MSYLNWKMTTFPKGSVKRAYPCELETGILTKYWPLTNTSSNYYQAPFTYILLEKGPLYNF